jgi:GntR family transcriptional regulator, arabinose operon transcriptional repressor
MAVARNSKAPTTDRIVTRIRDDLLSGQTSPDDYLPGERELSSRYGVGRVTVRRALKKLVAEGLIHPERGHGYRALLKSAGEKPGSPLVFVSNTDSRGAGVAGVVQEILVRADSQVMTVGVGERTPEAVLQVIVNAGAWGVLLESSRAALHQVLFGSGLPCVAVDTIPANLSMDCVLQDNHGGGCLAADYLLKKGHTKIGWFGSVAQTSHSLERFTGAQMAFIRHGIELRKKYVVDQAADVLAARKLLERQDRPTAVLCMWRSQTVAMARAAVELGLKLGRDLDLVGWTTEDEYAGLKDQVFSDGNLPAMIVWEPRDMARIALERIELRRRQPGLHPVRITVPVRLVAPKEK